MEDAGLVTTKNQTSPLGPQRRVFSLAKSFSIIIDVGPHLFKQNIIDFEVEPEQNQISKKTADLIVERDRLLEYPKDEGEKMKPFSKILTDIDTKLDVLEQERALLLSIRNSIMMEASNIIQRIDDSDSRRVFHSAIDEHNKSIERISQSLNLREDKVREIIHKLKTEFKTKYFN